MIGRAGRNGCLARAHIFCTSRKIKDPLLMAFAESDKENCRRRVLIQGLGSSEYTGSNEICCDNCGGETKLCKRLDFLKKSMPGKRKKKRKPVRSVDASLEEKLKAALMDEREKILAEAPGYRILGPEFVLSSSCISQLSAAAPVIATKEELRDFPALRPEYHDRIYRVMCDILACAAPPLSKRQK